MSSEVFKEGVVIMTTPHDIIKRGLWLEYKKFVLRNKKEEDIQKLIEENKPVVLYENDAYVMGLLKVVETDNLIHRFNKDMEELLQIKSTIEDKRVLIAKSTILKETLDYKNRFPEYFIPDMLYKNAISDLYTYLDNKYKEFNDLEEIVCLKKVQGKGGDSTEKKITYVQSKDVKKVIDEYYKTKKTL